MKIQNSKFKNQKYLVFLVSCYLLLVTFASKIIAQTGQPLGPIGGSSGFGPWGNLGGPAINIDFVASKFTAIISNIIGVMTIVAGLWFLFVFITNAFGFLTAGGDDQKMGKAAQKIGSSLIGLVIVVISYALISLLGTLLGFDILQPQKIIMLLKP